MRTRAVIAVGLLVAGLSGSTARDLPVVAITLQDGVPTALVFGCGEPSSVFVGAVTTPAYLAPTRTPTSTPTSTPTPTPVSTRPGLPSWSVRSEADVHGLHEITLLGQPPPGWTVSPPLTPPLLGFEPGHDYRLSARSSYEVEFTWQRIADLDPGNVLTATGRNAMVGMTRPQFAAQAEDSC